MKQVVKRSVSGAQRAGAASSKAHRDNTGQKVRGRKSELWQRIRAARLYAEKTQEDLAQALKPVITRSAVAYWESNDPVKRATPTPGQVMQVAKACRVPIQWLMDDAQPADGLYAYMQDREQQAQRPVVDPREEAKARAFWGAVEHTAVTANEHLSGHFNVPVHAGAVELTADLLYGRHLCGVALVQHDWKAQAAHACGQLLALERLLGHKYSKTLLVYSANGDVDPHAAVDFGKPLGVEVHVVHEVSRAVELLLKGCPPH